MAAEAGRRFGPYEIRSMLGAGGMGEVYVARDRKLDRDVALKLLPIDFAADADRLRRFELEARSASALNHPAIPAIYDFGNADGQPYISMELVHGQTVRQLLASGALPPKRALHIAAQIADGLAKAHDAGIVHRDLKPENLMVTDDGFAKILDFGLAKLVADTDEHRQTIAKEGTVPGSVMGTAGYMSPEQAAGQLADGRSDQFSFGLVLYELLTGTRAFDRPTPAERMSAIIRDEPTPIEQLNRAIPAPVRWIVERCLAKHPGERYASTRDLARDLANARDHLSEIATAAADAATLRTTRPTLREYGAWALAALLALLSGGLAFRSFAAPQPPAPSPLRFTISPPEQHAFAGGIGSSPFALSADGRRLAFLASGPDGRSQVWVRSFDSLDARSLPGTDGAFNPFWSPDGQSVGFFVGGRLKRVSLAGGDVATICDARSGGGASWNQAGTIVFADGLDGVLKQVPAAGGTASALTALDSSRGDNAHLHPVFHTDGRHYLFSILSSTAGGIYLGSLDSREIRKLIDGALAAEFAAPDVLAFIQGDRLLAQHLDVNRAVLAGTPVRIADGIDVNGPNASFSASPAGSLVYAPGSENVTQPSWFSRDGTAGATLGPPGTYVNLAISPDGTQVAIDRFTPTPAIWILNVARGTTTRETPGGLVYQSTPVWSPDGRTIVYALAASRPPNLFLKRVGSDTESEPLFQATYQSFPQSWSPDGEYILYATVEPKTGQDIWRVPTRDPRTPSPLIRTQYAESHPRISPDGRWLAYASNDGGRLDIYAVRLPGVDGKRVISTAGGNFPVWGRDGRELYYLSREGMVMAVAMRTDAGGGLSAGTPVSLFKAPPLTGGPGAGTPYDVAPDGRFLFNVFQRRTSPPVTVVLDWRPTEQPLSR